MANQSIYKAFARMWEHVSRKIEELVGDRPVSEQIAEAMNPVTILQDKMTIAQDDITEFKDHKTYITDEVDTLKKKTDTLDNKVDKIDGMGLSTNDFDDYYKQSVDESVDFIKNYQKNINDGEFVWTIRNNNHYSLKWKGADE